ncbi:phosphatidylinositol-4-phosphate 5-kinase, putative [Entamoeba dispar SAW760]|uniref:Phosphatidylinositol-4-phosphate 5-kinase, putative n=1 Tax=Entamoeba dispar (strain ATCC PRA-260 / SAW760) TaxID=370354 RepID=B0EP42_ENTDS|nr:phosphatidylinositol-4-phosphate 5-kinase, putative [Entamoeba dispar SAW760]EDR23717.1 phosphatidylinositol-4-phosphate 5-kinase, putative [Entamoeba dispar SAW760]|eukprot:EDR23717.1 phosphatidylinositol-4-phosphate 5-kinase, putative [Entamoeba dispar SAW760]
MNSMKKYIQIDNSVNFLGLHTVNINVDPNETDEIELKNSCIAILLHSDYSMQCSVYSYILIPNEFTLQNLITPFLNGGGCMHCSGQINQHTTSIIFNNIKLTITTAITSKPEESLKLIRMRCLKCQKSSEVWTLRESVYSISLNELLHSLSTTHSLEYPKFPTFPCKDYLYHILEFTGNGIALHFSLSLIQPFSIQSQLIPDQISQKQHILSEIIEMNCHMTKELMILRKQIPKVQKSFEARKQLYSKLNQMENIYLGQSLLQFTPSDLVKFQLNFYEETIEFSKQFNNQLDSSKNKESLLTKINEDISKSSLPQLTDPSTQRKTTKAPRLSLINNQSLEDNQLISITSIPLEDEKLVLKLIWNEQLIVEHNETYFQLNLSTLPTLFAFALSTQSYKNYLTSNNLSYSYDELNESTVKRVLSSTVKPHFDFKYTTIVDTIPITIEVSLCFACQFHLLRLLYYKNLSIPIENACHNFFRSVAYITSITTQGGKSKSLFFKTFDEQFLFKELKPPEYEAFLDGGGVGYFNYMLTVERKTVLVRNLGVFSSFIKIGNNKSEKVIFLIMENLFYGKEPTKTYDLKGTLKKRTLEDDELKVGLDGNFVQSLSRKPIIVSKEVKQELMSIIKNDTQMLSSSNVMDYSLIVGCDEKERSLRVGIIDFIRTYTWDKQLESVVKKIGALGQNPTVIEPELYRKRLLLFINSVFMIMPDDSLLE